MQAPVLASSDWLYRVLLRFYPPAFQARFAAEMAPVFRTLSREAYTESGAGGLLGLWLAALWDWAWAVLYQWELFLFKRRVKMIRIQSYEHKDAIQGLPHAFG